MKALIFGVVAVGLAALGIAQLPPPVECSAAVFNNGRMVCQPIAPTPTPTPCAPAKLNGLVVDKCAHPMPATLPKPAYLASYVDPQFGTTIRRISDAGATDEEPIVRPMYSTMQGWNDDESLLVLYRGGRKWPLLDGKTYAFKKYLNLISPSDVEQLNWVGNDFIVYPSNYNAIPNLMVHQVSTGGNSLLKNFSGPPTNCPTGDWERLLRMGADPMRMSWATRDSYVIGLSCGDTKFAYNLATQQVVGVVQSTTTPNAPMPSPTGQRFFFDGRSYDAALANPFSLGLASVVEHATLGILEDGTEFYGSVVFGGANEGALVLHPLAASGAPRVIVGPKTGWPSPNTGIHVSAIAHNAPGVMTVSMVGLKEGQRVLDQELLWIKAGQVYRVGHHRSSAGEGPMGYFGEPHASPSPSGTRILFASDWGGGPTVDAYVVELPAFLNP